METGHTFKKTWKTKIFLWLNRHWPRLDQWFLEQCDMYPCGQCEYFDTYGCRWIHWIDPQCYYETHSSFQKVNQDE